MKKKPIKKKINELTNAPKTNRQLAKEAKLIKKAPKDKYECDLYVENDGLFKFKYKIQSISKDRLKSSQLRHTHRFSDKIVKFSKIVPIKARIQ